MNPRVDKWLDLLDRAGWTGLQAAAAAVLTYLVTDGIGWEEGLIFVGGAVVAAIAKVIIGQNTGTDNTGSLIGRAVIEPSPTSNNIPEVTTGTAGTAKVTPTSVPPPVEPPPPPPPGTTTRTSKKK